MILSRSFEPEWLDELPPEDSRAIRSRRDLKRINAWMLQTGIMVGLLAKHRTEPPKRIFELGSGDGLFMLSIARRMAKRWPGVRVLLVDRQNIVSDTTREKFRGLGWQAETVTADVFDFLSTEKPGSADLISANLFLHHFSPAQLMQMFARAAECAPLFIACEPRRSSFALAGSHMLFAIGCNDVSRHDAVVSVRAGFSQHELSELWPKTRCWSLHEHGALPFTHCFVANRTASAADV
ncbi:MAG TPA: class I SAM-dependent methyltransferase [Micropepsaceae bacterium]|nr:class I SAM-dependent methyltransferase [Micropepsaceae bacterium]